MKNYTYSYLPEPLAYYFIHDESKCRTLDMEKDKLTVLERYKNV